jgi:very-short-patch-repair endonuclease
VIIEFDGWEFHSSRAAFERDRFQRNELELAGYLVLNFTRQQLVQRPDWVLGCIRRALAVR